jgi:hypothetical protein
MLEKVKFQASRFRREVGHAATKRAAGKATIKRASKPSRGANSHPEGQAATPPNRIPLAPLSQANTPATQKPPPPVAQIKPLIGENQRTRR